MKKYKLLVGESYTQKFLKEGIIKASEFISPTLGVRGRKIILDKEFGKMEILDDGARILDEIELEDTRLQMGVKMLKEAANKTNDKVGDGTTTTTILASGLVKNIVKDRDPLLVTPPVGDTLRIKKEINAGVDKIIKFIDEHKVDIDDKKVLEIGTISSNNSEIGQILSELFSKLGPDASIFVNDGSGMTTTHEIVEGMTISKGYISPFLITDSEKGEAVIENAKILITDCKLQNPDDAGELHLFCQNNNINDLVIIADEIKDMPLDFLVANKLRGNRRMLGIKAPVVGDAPELLKDLAILCGAELISKDLEKGLKDLKPEQLGRATRVIAKRDETSVVGGGGNPDEIKKRIKTLENQLENTPMAFDKERLQERISKLKSGIGYIKVGGATESEIEEKKAKIDDAINAVRAALKDGGIPGGGIMFLRASTILDDKVEGEKILKSAIQRPFEQIIKNADMNVEEAKAKILAEGNINYGLNVETGEYCDLVEAGVIDPALVAKTALQNAVSICKQVLDISGSNTLVRDEDEDKE